MQRSSKEEKSAAKINENFGVCCCLWQIKIKILVFCVLVPVPVDITYLLSYILVTKLYLFYPIEIYSQKLDLFLLYKIHSLLPSN